MLALFNVLLSCSVVSAAVLRASRAVITPAPALNHAVGIRDAQASCSLTTSAAFTLNGHTFPAAHYCACGNGLQAGASSSVGSNGYTTWECALGATPSPVSTQTSTQIPKPTWVVQVQLGVKSFEIGDYNQSNFLPLMQKQCNSSACLDALDTNLGSEPPHAIDFKFNSTHDPSPSAPDTTTGKFSVAGSVFPHGVDAIDALINILDGALLATSACSSHDAIFAVPEPLSKRAIYPFGVETIVKSIPQCRIVNFVQATLFSSSSVDGYLLASANFIGVSKDYEPIPDLCNKTMPFVEAALKHLPLDPILKSSNTEIRFADCQSPTSN